jgi:PKHD-type hydroxylase
MFEKIPSRQPLNSDDYAYWDNFLSESDINQLLNAPQWKEQQQGLVGDVIGGTDYSKRRSRVAWLVPSEDNKDIWRKITNAIADVNRTFFHFDLSGIDEPAQLTLYLGSEQSHYEWHMDSSLQALHVRKLSVSILLSNPSDFEGGELQIQPTLKEATTVEQIKGRGWFFPSYTPHRVCPVTKGVRKSLVLWVSGPPFR